MIELTGALQTVANNANVLFDTLVTQCGCAERHRSGSGVLTLAAPGRYLVTFSGNVAVPTGGTVGAITAAIAIEGEATYGATMTVTPAAVEEFFNISASSFVDVPNCNSCCTRVSVENITGANITVNNANLIAMKV